MNSTQSFPYQFTVNKALRLWILQRAETRPLRRDEWFLQSHAHDGIRSVHGTREFVREAVWKASGCVFIRYTSLGNASLLVCGKVYNSVQRVVLYLQGFDQSYTAIIIEHLLIVSPFKYLGIQGKSGRKE
jgi:hypothetical protein